MSNSELYLTAFLSLIGGLGLFLLGMKNLSDGLQTVAGASLKRIIAAVTNNRILAVGVGMLVTTIIQSSSITTVLVVGFVNSTIMTLTQAVGVIMGANIGTTITGWVLVLNIGKYGLPIAGVAALLYIFVKKDKVRYVALAVLGLGLVFMGLEIMKDGLGPIRKIPEFREWFHMFHADSYLGVLKTALVGCVLTMIVQSSSATLGITIAMASQGLIPFETAAALVLGENVGTTITAILASIGAGVNARRAAYFHALFNLFGVFWVTILFNPYLHVVENVVLMLFGISDIRMAAAAGSDAKDLFPNVTAGIATVHTLFNVSNTIIMLPLANLFAKFLIKVVPDRSEQPSKRVTKLDSSMLESPFAAIEQADHELEVMGRDLIEGMNCLEECIKAPSNSKEASRKVFGIESRFDLIQTEMTGFLSELMGHQIGSAQAFEAQRQLRICDDLESVSDYMTQILKLQLRLTENEIVFDEAQKQSLLGLHAQVLALFPMVGKVFQDPSDQLLQQSIMDAGHEITASVRHLRAEHWRSLATSTQSPLVSTTYSDMLMSYRKIKERLCQVVEAVSGIQYN